MMKTTAAIALAAALGAALPGAALAQNKTLQQVDASAAATYGDYRLNAGFPDDPYIIYVTAGGAVDASNVADGCSGMVAYAPDAQLTYRAGSLPLIIRTEADRDTTLLINGPDGRWYCDDDSGGSLNAELRWGSPPSGVYDIWVGTFGGGTTPAELRISELDSNSNSSGGYDSYSGTVDTSAPANFGRVSLSSGFTPDPRIVSLRAGGDIRAEDIASSCRGFVTRAPDVELDYDAGSLPLILSVDASSDTTLVVNGPDGQWYCNDDGGVNGMNPSIRFNRPMSGVYDIWVGTYSSGASQPAQLSISELTSE